MRSPRHATVVAYAALVVALSGSAYAAATVGSAQIVDNSIRSQDVRNGGLKAVDLSPSARAALTGIPARTRLVNGTGTPAANGNRLRTVLAGLGGATAAKPWTVRLGPGRFALDGATERIVVPDFVTLLGDGPLTVVESTAAANAVPVLDLTGSNVVRSLTVEHAGSNTGAIGIDGTDALGSLIDDVVVEARVGVVLEESRLRDSTVAGSEGVRVEPSTDRSELDDVAVLAGGFANGAGVVLGGPARLDGVDVEATNVNVATGLLVTAASGRIEVRDSSFRATGVQFGGTGIYVNPPSTSTVLVQVDGSRSYGAGSSSYGVRTDGSGARIRVGSSVLGGTTAVFEQEAADARCFNTHDEGYAEVVTC